MLDPILIYGWFGCHAFGVKGAAYATVAGQLVSCLLGMLFHIKVNRNISVTWRSCKPSAEIICQIYAIGIPAILAQALMSVMTYGMNIILGRVSDAMVTAYSLYYKVQQFVLFAAFGLRDAITPVISYAYGMHDKSRIRDGIRYGILDTLVVMVCGLLITELFAVPFAEIFGMSGETRTLFLYAMRIISVSFLFAGANIAFQGMFQALDGGKESLFVSVCRQCVFVLPVAYLFTRISMTSCDWLVWVTFPLAEFLTVIIAVVLFRKRTRHIMQTA